MPRGDIATALVDCSNMEVYPEFHSIPCNLGAAKIERIASDLADFLGKAPEPGMTGTRTWLEAGLRRLGGKILSEPEPTLASGSLIVRGIGDFDVSLSAATSVLRDNFTIAHELGHYFLHYVFREGKGPAAFRRYGTGPLEVEANRFAAGLLMPSIVFRARYIEANGFIESVALHFGVSAEAARIRAGSLRLVS